MLFEESSNIGTEKRRLDLAIRKLPVTFGKSSLRKIAEAKIGCT